MSDLRDIAKRRTPRAIFDYTDGAAGDEISAERSLDAFRRVEFRPSVLKNVENVDVSTNLMGVNSSFPVVLGPTGYTRMMHHSGESAVARAAGRAGVPYVLSTMGTTSLERLREEAPNTRRWFQLYFWRDRDVSKDLIAQAKATGCDTLVITVDTPVAGPRLRDLRNGMTLPPTLTPATFLDGALRPNWWINFLTTEPPEFASLKNFQGTAADLANSLFDPTVTIENLRWLRDQWAGNLLVKGVQTLEDAEAVVDAGADGVVLSNHGGRQLDRAPTPLEQLPAISEQLGSRAEIYLDGGVRSGADIAAAIAFGAQGVFVGRAYLYGLMAGGERGVDHMLKILQDDFTTTMQLIGATSVSELAGRASLNGTVMQNHAADPLGVYTLPHQVMEAAVKEESSFEACVVE